MADAVRRAAAADASLGASDEGMVKFGAPFIGDEEIAEVVDTLRSGWVTTGPKTRRFETLFADYVGSRFAVATSSCTAALHLSLDALDVGPGDEVVTTPLTFVATANVIEHCRATPVFADVLTFDGTIDPADVERQVTARTRAIIPVHYAGCVADVGAIRARHEAMPIVVDAAHAVEAQYPNGDSSAGMGATCATFSFYVTKNLVTGDGGMFVTEDEELAARVRNRSLHGLDNDAWKRYAGGSYGEYELVYPGFKYNLTDLQASLGLPQLARLGRALQRRVEIWSRYNEAFADLPAASVPPISLDPDGAGRHARHLYTLWVDWDAVGATRADVVRSLRDLGIGTGWHFRAVHLHRFYREKYGYAPGDFPVAEEIADRTISIPLSLRLTDDDVARVIFAVRTVFGGGRKRSRSHVD